MYAAPRFGSPWDKALASPESLLEPRCRSRVALDEDSLHDYDAIKYEVNLSVDFSSHSITAWVGMQLRAEDTPLSVVHARLSHELSADSVDSPHGVSEVVQLESDSVIVTLAQAMAPGDTSWIWFGYHGTPGIVDSWGGLRFAEAQLWRPQICFSMGDGLNLDPPPANYAWLPSFADPTDKVAWEAWIRVPTGKTVTSGGVRVDTVSNADSTTTWHYLLQEPVSTYLLFLAVSDYTIYEQRPSGPLIEHFVYPSRMAAAQTHFEHLPQVLDGFVERFGDYPFGRAGFAMTRLGDMEHATCVSHVDASVVASYQYDWLLFHELSHQWWGNSVTLGDWRDLWLNEGFATYCEALGMEIIGGEESYQDYVTTDLFPAGRSATDSYSIYDPDVYWGATVYQKGACVMHMLRRVMGDSLFFTAWRDYGGRFSYTNAVTADWQQVCEEHYGESLDWFFQPWVYGTRYPRYRVTSTFSDILEVRIEQIQSTGTYFRMPVVLELMGFDSSTARITVWAEAEPMSFEAAILPADSIPIFPWQVHRLDPDESILKTVEYVYVVAAEESRPEVPLGFGIESVSPNPFNSATSVTYTLDRTAEVNLTVFDLLGRSVSEIPLGRQGAGNHKYTLELADQAAGIYFIALEIPHAIQVKKAVLLK